MMLNVADKIPALTIIIDGGCPLCVIEMRNLKKKDHSDSIKIVDLHDDDFRNKFPDVDTEKAMGLLHGQLDSGEWLTGLDVTHKAWSLVGCGWRTAFLRWPIIRPMADTAYHFFARHRDVISKVLTGKSRLDDCSACKRYNGKG